jgi:hypothetical protein
MREFVSAGGELIIHGAAHLKNPPIPDLNSFILEDYLAPLEYV